MSYDTAPDGYVAAKDLADELGLRPGPLREWVNRNASNGDLVRIPRPGGGTVLYVSPTVAETARARYRTTSHDSATPVPQAEPPVNTAPYDTAAEGWRLALETAQANTRRLEADLATTKSERDTARVEAQAARRQAEEAERGMMTAHARIESLRAAWWQWYAVANGPWWRRLRGLPKPPAELNTPPMLAAPKG